MGNRLYLQEEDYNKLKAQISNSGGLKVTEICELLGINYSTYRRIKNTLDFDHFVSKFCPKTRERELETARLSEEKYGAVVRGDGSKDSTVRFDAEVNRQLKAMGQKHKRQTVLERLNEELFQEIRGTHLNAGQLAGKFKMAPWQIGVIRKSENLNEALRTLSKGSPAKIMASKPEKVVRPAGSRKIITPEKYAKIKYDYDYNKDLKLQQIAEKHQVCRAIVTSIGNSKDFNSFRAKRRQEGRVHNSRVTDNEVKDILKEIPAGQFAQVEIKQPVREEKISRNTKFKKEQEVKIEVKVTLKDIKRAKGGLLAELRKKLLGE